jgi:hypothetical protein
MWDGSGGVECLTARARLRSAAESSPPPGLRLLGPFSLRAVNSGVLPDCSELEKGPRHFLLFVLARAWQSFSCGIRTNIWSIFLASKFPYGP